MRVRTAELAAVGGANQDRVFVGSNAVVVLDGASGSDTAGSVSEYVEALGRRLIEAIERDPALPLQEALHSASRRLWPNCSWPSAIRRPRQ